MFKRLRTKLAEEAQRFPIQEFIDLNSSTGSPVLQPENEQFSINDEDDSNTSEMNSPSRTQEKASAEQEAMHFTAPTLVVDHPETIDPLSTGTENSALQLGLKEYVTQSDTESEREELHSTDLEGISKGQLIFALQKFRRKTQKYKAHYTEAITAFKEVLSEKEKLQHALSDAQDKTLRRLAELREQCQLEQQAKAHLEQNLQMMLDEKEQMISVLETKVRLLKEGNYSDKQGACQYDDSNCSMDLEDKKSVNEDSIKDNEGELQALREKIKRQEALLAKCKDTIRSNKERTSQLIDEKNNLLEQLDKKNREQENHQVQEPEIQSDLQVELAQMREKLNELEKQQEENSMAMAETKRNMHEELELREQQLCKLKSELQNVQREKDVLQKKVEEQDSKCIDLQNKHEEAISVLQSQLENTENSLEKERENLMHELSRGKAAAVSLVKEECGRKISSIEEEWKVKVEDLKQEHQKVLAEKEESERKINSIEEEWKVKVEELKQEYKKAITEKEEYGRKINSIEEEWNGKLEELKQEHQKALAEKEKEHGKALNNQAEEFKNFLARKNEEMSPSVTDQGVQKTVTVSDIDIQTDDLQKETEELDDNRIKEDINLLNSKLREPLVFIEANQSSISEELCDYKLQIAEFHRTLDQLKQKNVEEEAELKQKIEVLQNENNKLINNVKALDDLQREKEVIEDKLKQMEESCNKNNEANEIALALQDEVKRLKEECSISAAVQEELKRMKEENAISIELREENKQLKIKLDEHDKEKEEIKCTLQHEFTKLQSEKVKLEEELQKTKFRVELLNQQLTSKEPDDKTNLLMKEEIILLKEQLHLLETQTFGISHVDNYQNQLTIVKTNYEEKLKEKDIEHNSKLKQMVRDFSSQMEQKETEYEKMLSTFIEKGQELEGKMERKQRKEMAALEQELHQKSCALEDVTEHYQQILSEKEDELRNFKEKVKEAGVYEKSNGRVNEINQDMLQADANDWEDGWVDAEDTTSIPPTVVKAEIHNQESTQCKEHLEHIKTLESSIASSQEEIAELRFLLGLTNRAASSSDANYANEILQKLPEPTEFEYLRNILYEYMMGKEPMILARVIAAVLKFTEEQTREILQRETVRQTLKNNWMSS